MIDLRVEVRSWFLAHETMTPDEAVTQLVGFLGIRGFVAGAGLSRAELLRAWEYEAGDVRDLPENVVDIRNRRNRKESHDGR